MSPRLPFLALVVLALSGAALASEGADRPGSPVAAPAPPTEAAASTWFCAGGTASSVTAEAFADHTVVVDAGTRPVSGHLTVVPGDLAAAPPPAAVPGSASAESAGTESGGTPAPPATGAPTTSSSAPPAAASATSSPTTARAATPATGSRAAPPAATPSSGSPTTARAATPSSGSPTTARTATPATGSRAAAMPVAPGAPGEPAVGERVPVVHTFSLAAGEQARFRLAEMVEAPLAAAVVELDTDRAGIPPLTHDRRPGGEGPQVSHEVAGPQGTDSSPCTSRSSSTWHFAWGTTTRDASERLVLFNPFPNDVTVDAVFSTDRGVREPLRWQGLTVPARSVVAVDVGDDVTRRGHVAATLHVRGGRLVVDRLQVFDGQLGSAGLSVASGVTEAAATWTFAPGLVDDTHVERIVLYNPGEAVADVEVAVVPDAGPAPEPFGVVVRPGRYEVLDLGQQPRVTWGIPHTITVTSHDGVPVVAERITGTPAPGPATPTLRLDADSPTPG